MCHSGIYTGMAPEFSDRNGAKNAKSEKFCIFILKIVIKSEKNRDGGDNVGVLLTWSVHTSQYGN